MLRIVIVEDELRIREGLARLIEKINPDYAIVGEAEDGSGGIRAVTERRPDLVITDVRMPDLDGLEMLERLEASSIKVKAIVLSAYSDFSYAREAIKLGVSEYLLKPVNVGDLTRSLKKIDDQVAGEKQLRRQEGGRSLESVLYSIALGGVVADSELRASLAGECRVDAEGLFALATVYLGSAYEADGKRLLKLGEDTLAKATGLRFCSLELPRTNRLVFIAFNVEDAASTRDWFDRRFTPRMKDSGPRGLCVGWGCFRGLGDLKNAMQRVDAGLDWSIVLGDGAMLVWPDVYRTPVVPLSFPIAIESRVRSALCACDRERYESGIAEFLSHLHSDKVYSPKEIKNAFIRFFWSVLNAAREIEYEKYAALAQQDILERITFAVSWPELESAAKVLLELFPQDEAASQGEDTIVRRAKNVVREFYSQGISLNEVALKLNVTPEYMSALFHRVAGITFSSYIRDFRVQKAKELLIGTTLKLYAVGEQVGYRDSKYFCRVFKEATGQKPSDYRKSNR
jgi:two-component system, response regulator YesN